MTKPPTVDVPNKIYKSNTSYATWGLLGPSTLVPTSLDHGERRSESLAPGRKHYGGNTQVTQKRTHT